MKNQIHSINWFEIPVLDFNRTKTFYSTLYAYEIEVMEMGSEKMGILHSDPEQGGISGTIVFGKDYRPNADGIKYISMAILILMTSLVELKLVEGRLYKRKHR